MQQFREALPDSHPYRFVIHDRDSIFSRKLDQEVAALGVTISLRPPPPENRERYRLPEGHVIRGRAVPDGPHHEYWL